MASRAFDFESKIPPCLKWRRRKKRKDYSHYTEGGKKTAIVPDYCERKRTGRRINSLVMVDGWWMPVEVQLCFTIFRVIVKCMEKKTERYC